MPGACCGKGTSWQDSNWAGVHQSSCKGPMEGAAFECSVLLARVGGAGLLYLPWFYPSAACSVVQASACALLWCQESTCCLLSCGLSCNVETGWSGSHPVLHHQLHHHFEAMDAREKKRYKLVIFDDCNSCGILWCVKWLYDLPSFFAGEFLHVFSKSSDLCTAWYNQDWCKHTASTDKKH